MVKQTDNKIMSVPDQIFDQFLTELGEQKIPEEIIVRLKKTLVENGQISIDALKTALFSGSSTNV